MLVQVEDDSPGVILPSQWYGTRGGWLPELDLALAALIGAIDDLRAGQALAAAIRDGRSREDRRAIYKCAGGHNRFIGQSPAQVSK